MLETSCYQHSLDWVCVHINTVYTNYFFPGFSTELWAERATEQDSCRVLDRRPHTNKSPCPCAGGWRNAVTLFPPHLIMIIITIPVFIFIIHNELLLYSLYSTMRVKKSFFNTIPHPCGFVQKKDLIPIIFWSKPFCCLIIFGIQFYSL